MALAIPTPLPASWSFYADTIIGAVPLGPVTCSAFTASSLLSGFGTGTVTLPVGTVALPPATLLRLWSWRLWAQYDGRVVWCGVPTGIADEAAATVTLTLTELPGYLNKRVFDVAAGKTYTQVEQTAIAADLAAPVTDAGVALATDPGPGFKRDRTYAYLESTSRAELLTNLSQVISGPEFRAEYAYDSSGHPRCTLRIAYPRVGADTGLGLSVPGVTIGYAGKWDSDRLRTRTFAAGDLPEDAPEDAQRPVVVVDAPQSDLPRLDAVDDWPGVILTSTLTERANTASVQYAAPVADVSGSITVTTPPLGSYGVGDDVHVRIGDPLMPGTLDTTGRLTQMDIDAAAGTVALSLVLVLPPPKPRDTLTARLRASDIAARTAFHTNLAPVAGAEAQPEGDDQS